MWYEDLTECNIFKKFFPTIAIGWLENGKPYTQGEVPNEFCQQLYGLIKKKEITNAFLGVHECDLCDVKLPERQLNIINGFGSKTTFVVNNDKIYVFPDLIIHYIEKHNYCPPNEFIEAVLNYNHEYAISYLKKLVEKKYPYLKQKNESNNRTN